MKRTQEEIKMIAEEIRINVQKTILKEERQKTFGKMAEMVKRHQPEVLTVMPLLMSHYTLESRILNASHDLLKTQKAFEEYRKRVEERL